MDLAAPSTSSPPENRNVSLKLIAFMLLLLFIWCLPHLSRRVSLTLSSKGPCANMHFPFFLIGHIDPLACSQCVHKRVRYLRSVALFVKCEGRDFLDAPLPLIITH
jgi:hypothetical protein